MIIGEQYKQLDFDQQRNIFSPSFGFISRLSENWRLQSRDRIAWGIRAEAEQTSLPFFRWKQKSHYTFGCNQRHNPPIRAITTKNGADISVTMSTKFALFLLHFLFIPRKVFSHFVRSCTGIRKRDGFSKSSFQKWPLCRYSAYYHMSCIRKQLTGHQIKALNIFYSLLYWVINSWLISADAWSALISLNSSWIKVHASSVIICVRIR